MSVLYIRLRWNDDQRRSEQNCELDGVRVKLIAQYNAIAGLYFLTTSTLEDATIIGSQALVADVDLWRPHKHLAIPQGALFVEGGDATLDALDVTALLKYRTIA